MLFRSREWGEDSVLYQTRVLGNFPTQEEDSLIPLAWIEAAVARHATAGCAPGAGGHPVGEVEIGVDLARYGECESVACVRRGITVVELRVWKKEDLMQSAGRVVELVRRHRPVWVKVDVVGLGAGVVDRLHELGIAGVIGVNGAERPREPERFASLRAEIYFALRDRFSEGTIAIPADDRLIAQLAALRYGYTSRGQQKVEGKDEMRERGLPSPDRADALALCFAPVVGVRRAIARVGRAR